MAVFKELTSDDIKTTKESLFQLIDIAGSDISGSISRKKYDVWASGVFTGSLFQTIYDNDYTLAASNALFDATIGLHSQSLSVTIFNPSSDANGLLTFPSHSLQMREKIFNYERFAQILLGDKNAKFVSPYGSTTENDEIEEAMFFCFKRLFARDQIRRQTYSMSSYYSGNTGMGGTDPASNINLVGSQMKSYSDINSLSNKLVSYGGNIANIYTVGGSSLGDDAVGLLYLDMGIAVFDLKKLYSPHQEITGAFSSAYGVETLSASFLYSDGCFVGSASIDGVLDHIFSTRFLNTSNAQIRFQNTTFVNTAFFYCRCAADEFNYSSNPTYVDSENNIVVIEDDDVDKPFTFITSIALFNANNEPLAIGKLSRPVFKDDAQDITFKLRLDF